MLKGLTDQQFLLVQQEHNNQIFTFMLNLSKNTTKCTKKGATSL